VIELRRDCDGLSICPVLVGDSESGDGDAKVEIRGDVDLDTEFLRIFHSSIRIVRLRVRSRDKNASVW